MIKYKPGQRRKKTESNESGPESLFAHAGIPISRILASRCAWPSAAKAVALVLADYMGTPKAADDPAGLYRAGDLAAWPSVETIAEEALLAESSARRGLDFLKRLGVIRATIRNTGTGRTSSMYTLDKARTEALVIEARAGRLAREEARAEAFSQRPSEGAQCSSMSVGEGAQCSSVASPVLIHERQMTSVIYTSEQKQDGSATEAAARPCSEEVEVPTTGPSESGPEELTKPSKQDATEAGDERNGRGTDPLPPVAPLPAPALALAEVAVALGSLADGFGPGLEAPATVEALRKAVEGSDREAVLEALKQFRDGIGKSGWLRTDKGLTPVAFIRGALAKHAEDIKANRKQPKPAPRYETFEERLALECVEHYTRDGDAERSGLWARIAEGVASGRIARGNIYRDGKGGAVKADLAELEALAVMGRETVARGARA